MSDTHHRELEAMRFIHHKIGQSDLAASAGIARANVSRILNEWKRHKLVSRLSGYYCLENKSEDFRPSRYRQIVAVEKVKLRSTCERKQPCSPN